MDANTVIQAISFLSTLSLRRATPGLLTPLLGRRYFYPRSPCGERLCTLHNAGPWQGISIHALLAESDLFDLHALP